jgi:adenylyltransferase/sulfurtransferase
MREFTDEQVERYARHIILPQVGGEGQSKLLDAKVLVLGAGGLGSPIAMYLAAAGVGTIGIADFDVVDVTNLQRQILHSTADVGRPKTASAADTIRALNPDVEVVTVDERLDSTNAFEMFERYDVIVDGTDNFPTRYLANDACYLLRKPLVHGSIYQFEGQATVFDRREQCSPCYRCLFPHPPPAGSVPNCAQAGVFGVLAGVIGVIQATEAIKLSCGIGRPLVGRLLLYDALDMEFTKVRIDRDPDCPLCGGSPEITSLIDYEEFCGVRP